MTTLTSYINICPNYSRYAESNSNPQILSEKKLFPFYNYSSDYYYVIFLLREKWRDLTQSYDKSPYTTRKWKPRDNTKTPPKLWLHNDCGTT